MRCPTLAARRLVLFSGLTLASAIFYMFMTIALNPAFLKGALKISFTITHFVFMFGIALLGLITLVYIVYANSFLLSMWKKDYGTYMMLGARNSKIGRLIFTETIVVGLLAAVLGIIVGIGLTQVVSELLISQLGLQIHRFFGFYVPAMLGIVDVLFGLQFFKSMLQNPYDKIWIPFTIFLVLYVIYYLITVKLYEGIVLKNR
ncbi:FtsX-like permease family protein [Lactobacillus amylolyticus]|nr:FtsX-like permease family protein [Lactobacillus amylolyticus]QFY04315.1 FtsX-like permease family protein [Lactobacillus amylolyticus]TDG64175.1 hypothetical protein C5L18_001323 [Lactobacillus amylolyticus]